MTIETNQTYTVFNMCLRGTDRSNFSAANAVSLAADAIGVTEKQIKWAGKYSCDSDEGGPYVAYSVEIYGNIEIEKTTTPINNFVCACGEKRCNKKDDYCWQCEAPIAAKEPKPHLKNK